MKFALATPAAVGMFLVTKLGLPGRKRVMWRATSRATASYPPPLPEPTYMDNDAVLKKSSADWPSATVGETARAAPTRARRTMRKPRRSGDIGRVPPLLLGRE